MHDILDWSWLVLFLGIVTVRKIHERLAGHPTRLRGMPVDEATLFLLWGVAAGVLPIIWLATDWLDPFAWPFAFPVGLRIAGVVVFIAATVLLHLAHRELGRFFSSKVEFQEGHQLVTSGVYGWMRHPMYVAHALWSLAQALLVPNIIAGALALPLMAVALSLRIPRENRALRERFGPTTRQSPAAPPDR